MMVDDIKVKIKKMLEDYDEPDWEQYSVKEFLDIYSQWLAENFATMPQSEEALWRKIINDIEYAGNLFKELKKEELDQSLITFLNLKIETCKECGDFVNPISKFCITCNRFYFQL